MPGEPGVTRADASPLEVATLRSTDPQRLRRRLRGDLDAIVLQALRKEPARRYASATALADDLERHLGGHPVTARPDAWSYRAGKLVERHRWSIATGIAGLAVGIILLTLALPGARARSDDPGVGTATAGASATVGTSSVAAYRFYEEGRRAFIAGEQGAAYRLFDAALREDSTFALAAYYAGRAAPTFAERWRAYGRAVRLANGAPDRERLRIQTGWAVSTYSLSARALADTFTARYPNDIESQLFAGTIANMEGRHADALPHLRRVVAMDSQSLRATGSQCEAACQSLAEIIAAYGLMDSLGVAEHEIRRWIAVQPKASAPWIRLAAVLDQQDRPAEALSAYRAFASLAPEFADGSTYLAQHRVWERQHDEAARLLRDLMETGTERQRVEAAWYLAITLRQQGLLADALTAARHYRRGSFDEHTESSAPPSALLEAQVLFEMQRYAAAAALFDSVAVVVGPAEAPHWVRAKARAWALTHAATARAAMDDTAALAALTDTIAALGAQSALVRDRLLHHYVRGLLFTRSGQLEAATTEYRRAMSSPNMGYTRINLELAMVLLRLGRSREAVAVLQAALRGGLEASNLYVTRTELYALLGEAWEAAGRPDSAGVHYRAVIRDWSRAESPFAVQRQRVARRLAALHASR